MSQPGSPIGSRSGSRTERPPFDPRPHEAELLAIIAKLRSAAGPEPPRLEAILREHPRAGKGLFSRSEIIAGFRHFARREGWAGEESEFVARLRKRRVRTLSGVAPVTVLTKPFPCPGRCIFCPNDVRMPKSYLSAEPGAQRATQHHFDPYHQTRARLQAFHELGHPTDKVELIVLGGTWSFYPEPYRIWFVKRCLDALNDFDGSGGAPGGPGLDFLDLDAEVDGSAVAGDPVYNRIVSGHLKRRLDGRLLAVSEHATWAQLDTSQRGNESSACRAVGLSLETRPDQVTRDEVLQLRRLGATKIQLGFQSLNDRVLELNRRGHGTRETRQAIRLLREAGFKIHAHWMPNLYGSDPEQDLQDFEQLFADPGYRPDELKIYPTSLIETAELMQRYLDGSWRPYEHDVLVDLVAECMARTPEYCRLTRVIRDISSTDIVVGNRTANLREVAERKLAREGRLVRDIRARELRDASFDPECLKPLEIRYQTGTGLEHFLQFCDPEDRLLAFLRLSLPERPSFIEELGHAAVIREVHVYGAMARLGERHSSRAQHLGLGRRLIERAAQLAREGGYPSLAVISALGTRPYYESLGFTRGPLYQHLDLTGACASNSATSPC